MGRVALFIPQWETGVKQIIFSALLFFSGPIGAVEIAGVNVEPTRVVDGQTLTLNGAGLRTATMLHVKVYVAGFYAPAPLKTEQEVLKSTGPLRFDFTFVRAFNQQKVSDAWNFQFKESNTHAYPDLEKDVASVVKAFGPIKKFGVETFELTGDETRVIDDGQVKATIKGRDFQKAFLSMWFGAKPVMPTLKAALLGKST